MAEDLTEGSVGEGRTLLGDEDEDEDDEDEDDLVQILQSFPSVSS